MRFVGNRYQYEHEAILLDMDGKFDRVVEVYRWKSRGKWILEFFGELTAAESALFRNPAATRELLKAFKHRSEIRLTVYNFSRVAEVLGDAK